MQGFNMGRYYPPDASHPPTFNTTTHPLGARARKPGSLTVRFELPFAVWCQHCTPEAIVGQGVRFNAEKKKVGNYYSTPIWSFRMKHTACGGAWEIRTDPKNAAYVVVEGARKREYGHEEGDAGEGDGEGAGEMKFLSEGEREKRREDAFAALEGRKEDGKGERERRERVEELYEGAEVWRDMYGVNARMRRVFRGRRKELEREGRRDERLRERLSFGFEVAEEVEGDGVRAGLVEFGREGVEDVSRKPLFEKKEESVVPVKGRLKAEIKAEKSRKELQQALVGNSRVAIDPFLAVDARREPKLSLGIKRKRDGDDTSRNELVKAVEPPSLEPDTPAKKLDSDPSPPLKKPTLSTTLVDYDSD